MGVIKNVSNINIFEYVDKKRANWLINNIDIINIRKFDDINYNPKKDIINYCKLILKSKKGDIEQIYTNDNGFGRLFLKNGQIGFQNMIREYRSILACNDYYDLDIKNCQPTILNQYCQKNNIGTYYLNKYVLCRDEFFESIKNDGIQKDEIKIQIIKIIYGGKINDDFINKLNKKNKSFILKFEKEIKNILIEVEKLNPDIKEYAKLQEFIKDKRFSNIKGSTTAYLCQDFENKIINYAYQFLKKKKYDVGALCFDGLMIRNTLNLNNDVILSLNKFIESQMGYRIEFVIKPFENIIDIPINELNEIDNNKNETIVENDNEGAIYILNKLGERVKNSNGRYFIKTFENCNIYKEDTSSNFQKTKDYILNFILKMDVKMESNGKIKIYSQNITGALNLMRGVFIKIEDDLNFTKKMWESNLNKLCFKNGYYDFKSRSFKDYDNETYTPIYINYDYEKADPLKKKEYFDLILDPIFPEKTQQKYLLNWLSRGLAGCYTEKTWGVGLGLRDSGKGVLTESILETIGNYGNTFNMEEMLCSKTGFGDNSKKMGWLIPFEFSRLNFSSEVKTEDDAKNKLTLDGDIIKKISSGGDDIKARLNFKDQITFKIQGRIFAMLNELIKTSSNDCMEKVNVFTFQNVFKRVITEEDEKINEKGSMKYIKADDNIKFLIKEQSFKLALLEILLENYTDEPLEKPEILNDNKDDILDVDENIENKINEYIECTNNYDDKILISDVNKYLKPYINLSRIKTNLKKMGIIEVKSNGLRYYRCMRIKNID